MEIVYNFEMSFTEDILVILSSYHSGYKLMRRRMRGYTGPASFKDKFTYENLNDQTLRTTLYRLKKKGLIENNNKVWNITQKGKEYLKNQLSEKLPKLKLIRAEGKPSQKKNMIIIFDIPETERRKRDWLREALGVLSFSRLQKSVWIGPAPLPKDFLDSLNKIKIISYLRFFKATEEDVV